MKQSGVSGMQTDRSRAVGPSANSEKPSSPAGRPLVSVVVPAYNESQVLDVNLGRLCDYLDSLSHSYRWEVIVVNDGSADDTGEIADAFASTRNDVRVLHHPTNFGLGQALQYAFSESRGAYVVTMDLDMSYSPEHIESLLQRISETGSKVVALSPYMKGGKLSRVPWLRRMLSVGANRFLSAAARGNLSTLTGMVRVYDGRFLERMNLRSMGMDINPEIIYKTLILQGRIEEIPAHLDWGPLREKGVRRVSRLRMLQQITGVLLSGFLFRPVMFFILPGLFLSLIASYAGVWMLIHCFNYFREFSHLTWLPDRVSEATAAAFRLSPHSFIVAGIASMLAIQLIGLGIMALQSKSYFEETFYLGSRLLGLAREREGVSSAEPGAPDNSGGD